MAYPLAHVSTHILGGNLSRTLPASGTEIAHATPEYCRWGEDVLTTGAGKTEYTIYDMQCDVVTLAAQ